MKNYQTRIREFLLHFFQDLVVQDDDDIFASGLINSLFAMQLILFIEDEFAVKVENEDLKIDNFRTINAMASLVERKKV